MADTNRGLISYTDKDYNTLVQDFWDLVPKLTNLWKPEADADPGVVLGKILASAADILNVSIDYLANEVFAPSVIQRKDAEKIFGLIGYAFLGILAVGAFGMAMIFLPAIVVLGLLGITGIAKGVI